MKIRFWVAVAAMLLVATANAAADKKTNNPGRSAKAWVDGNRIRTGKRIRFQAAKTTIRKESLPVLDAVADVLKANPGITRLRIEGHVAAGDERYGLKISDGRARAVRGYLVTRGVAVERLIAVGYGDTRPIVPNKTEKERDQNRRIELRISEIDGKPVD